MLKISFTRVAALCLALAISIAGSVFPAVAGEESVASRQIADASERAVLSNCNLVRSQQELGYAGMRGVVTPNRLIYSAASKLFFYNRTTCALISETSYESIFGFNLYTGVMLDTDIIYDSRIKRCVIYAAYKTSPLSDFSEYVHVGISRNQDCLDWNTTRIEAIGAATGPFGCLRPREVFDDVTLGVNINRIVVTADMGYSGSLLSLDKNALLAGTEVTYKCFRNIISADIVPSITADTEDTMVLISADDSAADRTQVRQWYLQTSSQRPSTDTLTLMPSFKVAAWQSPPEVLQPNQQPINAGSGRFNIASRQVGPHVWNAQVVKSGAYARTRIYKFEVGRTRPLLSYQPTTSACQSKDNLIAPSLDVESSTVNSNLFVTVLRTCPDKPKVGNITHMALWGPNQSSSGWLAAIIGASPKQIQTGIAGGQRCDEGDYGCNIGLATATQKDPADPTHAWSLGKIVTGSNMYTWRGKAAKFGP